MCGEAVPSFGHTSCQQNGGSLGLQQQERTIWELRYKHATRMCFKEQGIINVASFATERLLELG